MRGSWFMQSEIAHKKATLNGSLFLVERWSRREESPPPTSEAFAVIKTSLFLAYALVSRSIKKLSTSGIGNTFCQQVTQFKNGHIEPGIVFTFHCVYGQVVVREVLPVIAEHL